ncbi:MAG TPA: glycosyltransferase family 1 protein [Gemmatimonadaceae bacterium]|nr:glycosyltransferase family 1 protein [Gemmatimonadaceae bacterium]
MNVVFDAERLRNPNSGLGQFCGALGQALLATKPDDTTLSFITPPAQLEAYGPRASTIPTAWWHRFRAPIAADVWHATHQDYWIRPPREARVVLSIMDLNFLERADYSAAKKARRLAAVQRKIDRASGIATISEFTAGVVRRQLQVPDIPLRVIHLGNPMHGMPSSPSRPADPRIAALTPGSFFVFVGVLHPKKNVHTLLPVLRSFPGMSLVLAGPDDHPYARGLRDTAIRLGIAERVIVPGPVDGPTKRWLYENSRALLFPSLSEGFGLPVVEAMSFGKPAFLSRLTSLPEIGGGVATYFDSFEPDAMGDVLRRGLEDYDRNPGRAGELRAHAARYSWTTAATAYWSLYAEVHRSRRR